MDGFDKRTISVSLGFVVVLCYYGWEITRGYARLSGFPVTIAFADLPNCPLCDHLSIHFPILDIAIVSALIYGAITVPTLIKKKLD